MGKNRIPYGLSAVAKVFPIIVESIRIAAHSAYQFERQARLDWKEIVVDEQDWKIKERTVDRDEKLTDAEVLERHLGPAQRETLLQFQKEDEIPDAQVRTMAQITGRGYRPPTHVEIWRNYYEIWNKIGFFAPAELYVWVDDTDWYVAESWQEATELWIKRLGEKREDYYDGQENDGWRRMGDDEKFSIFWPDDDWPPSLKELPEETIQKAEHDESAGVWTVEITAKEWTEVNGKGFLASSEY